MNTIKMPRADWDMLLMILEDVRGPVTDAIARDIDSQLDKQEH